MNAASRSLAVAVLLAGFSLVAAFGFGHWSGQAARAAAPGQPPASNLAARAAATALPVSVSETTGAPGAGLAQAPGPRTGGAAAHGREGRVEVDPERQFVHYRVGNKNVKRIHAAGDEVWIGTSGGMVRYNTRTDAFRFYDVRDGLLSNGIFHVGALQGRIVLGTYGGGMSLLDEASGEFETFNIPEGLGDAFVYDVLEASNGDVWIATWSGVNRVRAGALRDRSRWELHTVQSTGGGLPNDWVYGLAEGRDGEIWLATEGGLARFRDGRWDNWNHARGLGAPYEKVRNQIQFKADPSRESIHHARQKEEMGLQDVDVAYNPNYIVSLAVDRDGTVWAGTWGGGLSRYDGSDWRTYTVADGLPGNHVFMLHLDPDGRLWIGTNNGLARMTERGFDTMTTSDGLFSNIVFSMTTGPDGSLWVGSYGGLVRIRQTRH
ncbi:MAG: regulator [Burkholderiales bacterium]|nr:MAG: regulator [Burkholderiales bacterium]